MQRKSEALEHVLFICLDKKRFCKVHQRVCMLNAL